jgi:hypothetical protein
MARQRVVCLLAVLAIGVTTARHSMSEPAITTYGERSANAPRELGAFAFLVGKWEGGGTAKTADGKTFEFGGVTWIGRYVLSGMAIADEIHGSTPDGKPAFGISLRQYDAVSKAWIVEFLNVSNSFLRRQVNASSGAVKVDGATVVVIGEAPDTWGRETYRVESHDRFTYTFDLSNDGGRTWNVGQVEMSFSRKE